MSFWSSRILARARADPPKIVGESVDKTHPNTIAVTAFSFGIENPTTIGSASGGAGAGKPSS
jgi:hypothetical protein